MKEYYFFTPKKTLAALGLSELAETRRSNSDKSVTILMRSDLVPVQPAGDEIPEGYTRVEDLVIPDTIKVLRHDEALTATRKGKWITTK